MSLQNAGLETEAEAFKALVDGREFEHEGCRIWFDVDMMLTGSSPFRCDEYSLWADAHPFSEWLEKVEWWAVKGAMTLCWVSDHEDELYRGMVDKTPDIILLRYVTGRSSEKTYYTSNNVDWKYAIPFKAEDLVTRSVRR